MDTDWPIPFMIRFSLQSLRCTLILMFSLVDFNGGGSLASRAEAAELMELGNAFFAAHCADCHDATTSEGGLDLSKIEGDLDDPQWLDEWVQLFDRVESGEMPPPEASSLTDAEREAFLDQLRPLLTEAHAHQKGTQLRRLNASEYQNTLNDLFGTNLQLADFLPADGRSHEFDNVGSALNMSMVQLERYLTAADLVVETSLAQANPPPKQINVEASFAKTLGAEKFLGKTWLLLPDGAVVIFQPWTYPRAC